MSLSNVLVSDTSANFKIISANDVNANTMTCLSAPSASTDVANKAYVDSKPVYSTWVPVVNNSSNVTAYSLVSARYQIDNKLCTFNIRFTATVTANSTFTQIRFDNVPGVTNSTLDQYIGVADWRTAISGIVFTGTFHNGTYPLISFTSGAGDAGQLLTCNLNGSFWIV